MSIWKTNISLEDIAKRRLNTMVEALGIEFTEIGEDFLVGTMPVDKRTRQYLGIMHGGASCALAESVGSVASNYTVDLTQFYCVGLSIYTQHIRSVRSGEVTGKASPIHLGRSTQVWNIDITDEEERLVSTTRLTMAVLKRQP